MRGRSELSLCHIQMPNFLFMPLGNQWALVSTCGTLFFSLYPFPAEVVCKSTALNSDERQFSREPGV